MMFRSIAIIFYISFIAMELSYIYLVTSLIDLPLYTWLLILTLYVIAFASKLLGFLNKQSRIVLIFSILLSVLMIAGIVWDLVSAGMNSGELNIANVILRLLLVLFIWFMGYTIPIKKLNYLTVIFRVQLGILLVLIFSQIAGKIIPVVVFFIALTSVLFLSRWTESPDRKTTFLSGPNIAHFALGWLVFILPSVLIMLAFSPNLARSLVNWLYNILSELSDWLYLQHQAASNISGNFKFNFSCNMRPEESLPPSSFETQVPSQETTHISPIVTWIILFFVLAAIITLIVLMLLKRNSAKSEKTDESVQYEVQPLHYSFWGSITNLFFTLIKRIWRKLQSIFIMSDRRKSVGQSLLSIRALYRSLINWAAKKGISTRPSLTPLEYLELIKEKFPDYECELRDIIDTYLVVRYSQSHISVSEYDRAIKAWNRLAVL